MKSSAFQLEMEAKTRKLHALDEQIKHMQKNIVDIKASVDEQEQYSRRNCLRFHGVPETAGENTDKVIIELVKEKMGVELHPSDIDRSHRITPRNPKEGDHAQPKSIIVKFSRYNARDSVYRARTKLRRTNIYIHEDLTAKRSRLLYKSRNHTNVEKTWTSDGRIIALTKDNRKVSILRESDIEKL